LGGGGSGSGIGGGADGGCGGEGDGDSDVRRLGGWGKGEDDGGLGGGDGGCGRRGGLGARGGLEEQEEDREERQSESFDEAGGMHGRFLGGFFRSRFVLSVGGFGGGENEKNWIMCWRCELSRYGAEGEGLD